jgi:uncharacterized protein (DUF433 family)
MERVVIVRDAETGEAVVAGTGVTVAQILRELAGGPGVEAVLRRHPELTEEAVAAAISFAIQALRRESAYSHEPGARAREVHEPGAVYGAPATVGEDIAALDARIDELAYEIDFLKAIREGLRQVESGELVSHEDAMAELRAIFGK